MKRERMKDDIENYNDEEGGFLGLVDAVIDYRKNNPEPIYVSDKIKERMRIISIIDEEIERMKPYKSNSGSISALGNIKRLILAST